MKLEEKSFFNLYWKKWEDKKPTTSRALSFNLDEASAWVLEVPFWSQPGRHHDDCYHTHCHQHPHHHPHDPAPHHSHDLGDLLVLTCLSSTSRIASFRRVSDRCRAASASFPVVVTSISIVIIVKIDWNIQDLNSGDLIMSEVAVRPLCVRVRQSRVVLVHQNHPDHHFYYYLIIKNDNNKDSDNNNNSNNKTTTIRKQTTL